jgi:aspartyl-tRNA(Asn)/glutamyl-tRNA(Gln) amidotransferase subunit B
LEVHAELKTRTKMFCSCAVVDTTRAQPNTSVCPVCAGMPGTLPVLNRKAVELGVRAALALECEVPASSIFARKNYFYPDLPKGYQISQYETPLAKNGRLVLEAEGNRKTIRIRRAHLEEDTGKLTHIESMDGGYSLVDLNRAGVPLLEIVTEPDLSSPKEAKEYAVALRHLLRWLDVSSGDMEKGALRLEANVSVRPVGSVELGIRTEIKNLNSFNSMEKALQCEIDRQIELVSKGKAVVQETVGWDESTGVTFSQRDKEEAHDYRYFPEPDIPALIIDPVWLDRVRSEIPELPSARSARYRDELSIPDSLISILVANYDVSDYFESVLYADRSIEPVSVANWICGELTALMNEQNTGIGEIAVSPADFAKLIGLNRNGTINLNTAKTILGEMFQSGKDPGVIAREKGLIQVSDPLTIAKLVEVELTMHAEEAAAFRAGKESVFNWLYGKVMRQANGKVEPHLLREELQRQLEKP